MALEFENNVGVLGRFGEACEGSMLDWRHKCVDEILWNIPTVLVDQHFDGLPYRALISSTTSINFRELWESEGGDDPNCCPSTANSETEICDFQLPELQFMSIGVEPRCYWEWEKEFCKKYNIFKGCSPFIVSGGQVQLLPQEEEISQTFMSYIAESLAQAIWDHLYRTGWMGRDEKADQFNGLWYYLENGVQPQDQTPGGCDHPLRPTNINICEYIHGAAACAAGACAGPGDCILPLGDPDRPADAPADNIWTINPGLSCEASMDITGFDVVDLMVAWLEYITNEVGVDVLNWFLGIPKNQYKCIAQVAACKQACSGGDCRHLYNGIDNRDAERATREKQMIASRMLNLYPYEETSIEVRQSTVLRQTNRLIFIPERIRDMGGNEVWWMLWAWRNRAAERENFFGSVPNMREALELYPSRISDDFSGLIYDGTEFENGDIMDATAWDWLSDRECNSVRWWNNAESGMIPQCSGLWLVMDGICCDSVLTQNCCDNLIVDGEGNMINPNEWAITDCVGAATPATFTSAIRVAISDNSLSGYQVGDEVDYLALEGKTTRGTITAIVPGTSSDVTVAFNEEVDCADNGGAAGGVLRDAVGPTV